MGSSVMMCVHVGVRVCVHAHAHASAFLCLFTCVSFHTVAHRCFGFFEKSSQLPCPHERLNVRACVWVRLCVWLCKYAHRSWHVFDRHEIQKKLMSLSNFLCASFEQSNIKIPGKSTINTHICKCAYRSWPFLDWNTIHVTIHFSLRIIQTIPYQNPRENYKQYARLQMCVSIVAFFFLRVPVAVPLVHTQTQLFPPCISLCLSPSRSNTHTFCHCLSLSVSVPLVHTTHILSLSISLCLSPSRSHTHTLFLYVSLSAAVPLFHTHTLFLRASLSCTCMHSLVTCKNFGSHICEGTRTCRTRICPIRLQICALSRCSVWQWVAVCGSVLQCDAVRCSELQWMLNVQIYVLSCFYPLQCP